MQVDTKSITDYIHSLPAERVEAMNKLFKTIKKSLPKGFEATMAYGMITFVVPFRLYPKGYHCNPDQQLPFISIASQKNFVAIYHMGIYAKPDLLKWFTDSYKSENLGKLDIGKSCIRFKKMEMIPFDLIANLCSKMSPQDWITCYESAFIKK
ncbi:MAG: DUF1801 domain-containing protein [Bacteroidota bacterium]